jgi:predicted DNA-binding transcriptional regulator AlpA
MPDYIRYVRKKRILEELGVNDATFWSWRRSGVFNVPAVILNPNASREIVVWPEAEYEAWKASRPRRVMARSPRRTPYPKGYTRPPQKKMIVRPSEKIKSPWGEPGTE